MIKYDLPPWLSWLEMILAWLRPGVASDELWPWIESLLPAWPARRSGPNPLHDRSVLQDIVFVHYTGIRREGSVQELDSAPEVIPTVELAMFAAPMVSSAVTTIDHRVGHAARD
jgi:hypothetical protein